MDERALAAAQAELLEWGLLEQGEHGLAWTRRFRGAVMREAGRLAEEERAGRAPSGPPLATAVRAAWAAFPLPPGAPRSPVHEKLLLAVEVAALPEAVRRLVGA